MFYNLSGYEIQSGNVSAHENHPNPDLCSNLKSEPIVVTSKCMNSIVVKKMRIRSWCQHFRNNKDFTKRRYTAEKITSVIKLERKITQLLENQGFKRSFIRSAHKYQHNSFRLKREFAQKLAYAF